MKTYKVEIKISDSKVVRVKAINEKEAIRKVEKMYENDQVTLCGLDIDHPEFTIL